MKRVAVALVDSLLTAMVRADGDALVMHVGERPIVVAGTRTIDLSTHGMNLGAMVGMLGQLLSGDALASLKEFGAVEHGLPSRGDDRFSVVAARSGDDIWIEIRRRRGPETVVAPPAPAPVAQESETLAPSPGEPASVEAGSSGAPSADPAPDEHAPAAEPVADPASVPLAAPAPAIAAATDDAAGPEEPPTVAAAPELAMPLPSDRATPEQAAALASTDADRAPAAEAAATLEPAPADSEATEATEAAEPPPVVVEAADATATVEETPAAEDGIVAAAPKAAEPDAAVPEPAILEPVAAEPSSDAHAQPETASATPMAAAGVDAASAPADAAEPVEEPEMVEAVAEATTVEALAVEAAAPAEAAAATDALAPAASADLAIEMPSPVEIPAEPVLASASASAYSTSSVPPVVPMEPVRHAGSLAGGPPSRPVTPQVPASASDGNADQPAAPPETPVTRTVRIEVPERAARAAGLDRLLRAADGVGAAELFLVSQARPYVRVGGNVRPLSEESALAAAEIDALIADVTPEPQRDAVRRGDPAEWLIELPEIGRVRCSTFRDLRGPGANFHFAFLRAATADELQLSAETRRLATEPDGLILVAGGAAADRSAIVAAFVDILNNQRADYIVTLEPQVRVLHANREALISQREVGSDAARLAQAARAALRETPDVLVIEGVTTGEVARLAIEAASQDRLVIASIDAPSTPEAVQRFIGLVAEDQRAAARSALAQCFRGAVAQLLLRKVTGGKIAARELLPGSRPVSRLLAGGDLAHLASSDTGIAQTTMADTIVEYVRTGVVDLREAMRKAPDAEALVARLNAAGVDLGGLDR